MPIPRVKFKKISDLSLGWLVGRSGHCTVSGPSGDGVSGAPSGLGDSATCCSSVKGCSSIQLANTSMVWESKSPATSGRDHREVELSEFKKKRWIMECCIANLCWTSPPDDHATVYTLRSRWQTCSENRVSDKGQCWNVWYTVISEGGNNKGSLREVYWCNVNIHFKKRKKTSFHKNQTWLTHDVERSENHPTTW